MYISSNFYIEQCVSDLNAFVLILDNFLRTFVLN